MSKTLVEQNEALAVEIATAYLGNMEFELGKKYNNNDYQINPGLSDSQYKEIKDKHDLSDKDFADLYSEFQKMKPTEHLQQVMGAFTASGGSVDIEPDYDESSQRLNVTVDFIINDNKLEKIEGLSPIEDCLLRMEAMLQIDTVLSGTDETVSPEF